MKILWGKFDSNYWNSSAYRLTYRYGHGYIHDRGHEPPCCYGCNESTGAGSSYTFVDFYLSYKMTPPNSCTI